MVGDLKVVKTILKELSVEKQT